jgi:membrane protease subunit HflC
MILRVTSIVLALIVFIAYSSVFVVDERQKALVLQFGQVSDVK